MVQYQYVLIVCIAACGMAVGVKIKREKGWRKMAEKEEPFVLSDDNMLRLTGDIWNTSRFLFTTFDNEWQETIVDIYRREATTIQKGTRENHLQNQ